MEKQIFCLEKICKILEENGLLVSKDLASQDLKKEISFLTYDSREVCENTFFICKGASFKPEFLRSAREKGAVCYISCQKYDEPMPYIIVNDIRRAMALLANIYFKQVWKKLTLIGLTGTKGKSTTAYFLKYILDEYLAANKKAKSAILSSIENYDGIIFEESHLTTPETLELHRHFDNAIKSNIDYLIMEVSSQALKYDRTYGITYDVAAFLNIGEDHISSIEHTDFEDYFESKLKLLSQCKTLVLNKNSDKLDKILEVAKTKDFKLLLFGNDIDCDIYAYNIKTLKQGIEFSVKTDKFDEVFEIGLPGVFNVENALAAIAITSELRIPLQYIKSGLKKARVSGRMELFTNKTSEINVIVDYAHNKMSFETLFSSMKEDFPDKKIAIVFGCPGKKALARRRELGEIAGKYSDMVYLTEEDAGEESILDICQEIAVHLKKENCKYKIIEDRREAIKEAIKKANKDTIVLITGKGRETRQKRGTMYIDTPSDVDYVLEFLKDK